MPKSKASKRETDVHFAAHVQSKFSTMVKYGEGGKQLTRLMRTRLTLDLHGSDWSKRQLKYKTMQFAY